MGNQASIEEGNAAARNAEKLSVLAAACSRDIDALIASRQAQAGVDRDRTPAEESAAILLDQAAMAAMAKMAASFGELVAAVLGMPNKDMCMICHEDPHCVFEKASHELMAAVRNEHLGGMTRSLSEAQYHLEVAARVADFVAFAWFHRCGRCSQFGHIAKFCMGFQWNQFLCAFCQEDHRPEGQETMCAFRRALAPYMGMRMTAQQLVAVLAICTKKVCAICEQRGHVALVCPTSDRRFLPESYKTGFLIRDPLFVLAGWPLGCGGPDKLGELIARLEAEEEETDASVVGSFYLSLLSARQDIICTICKGAHPAAVHRPAKSLGSGSGGVEAAEGKAGKGREETTKAESSKAGEKAAKAEAAKAGEGAAKAESSNAGEEATKAEASLVRPGLLKQKQGRYGVRKEEDDVRWKFCLGCGTADHSWDKCEQGSQVAAWVRTLPNFAPTVLRRLIQDDRKVCGWCRRTGHGSPLFCGALSLPVLKAVCAADQSEAHGGQLSSQVPDQSLRLLQSQAEARGRSEAEAAMVRMAAEQMANLNRQAREMGETRYTLEVAREELRVTQRERDIESSRVHQLQHRLDVQKGYLAEMPPPAVFQLRVIEAMQFRRVLVAQNKTKDELLDELVMLQSLVTVARKHANEYAAASV